MIQIDAKIDLATQGGTKEAHYKLAIKKEDLVVVFGSSGAGKTTLLRLIAGLEKPKSGVIKVFDEIWFDSDKNIDIPTQKRGVGFVFQDYALFPKMSIKENILYACKTQKQMESVSKFLELVELKELKDKYPNQLSGGQKQRVALIRALIGEPKILLLDESLSALDEELRGRLQDELLEIINQYKTTTLFVSHDKSEAIKLGDKIAVVADGKVVQYDKPSKVFNKNMLEAKVVDIDGLQLILQIGSTILSHSVHKEEIDRYQVGSIVPLHIS